MITRYDKRVSCPRRLIEKFRSHFNSDRGSGKSPSRSYTTGEEHRARAKGPGMGHRNLCCRALFVLTVLCLVHYSLSGQDRASYLTNMLTESDSNYIFVVAHRGDWRNAPENSLQAVENCIAMGVDMVEIDVRLTKDSVFVLMHDDTIDRTTNGKGRVAELTWPELSQLRLRDGIGAVTNHRIPTLEQVFQLTDGKILVNLDKAYGHLQLMYDYLREKKLLDQVVFKDWMKDYHMLRADLDSRLDSILFIPIVSLDEPGWREVILSYSEKTAPVAFELLFKEEGYESEAVRMIKKIGSRVWINSLWPEFNAGHNDERAVYDPEGTYGWLVYKGTSLIQTDRPELLISFLRDQGVR